MTTDDAAEQALDALNLNCYIHTNDYTEDAYKDGFIDGANYGYKETIKQAKEWLHNNLHLYIMSGSKQVNYTFLMDGLEKAMNKLWEEKK